MPPRQYAAGPAPTTGCRPSGIRNSLCAKGARVSQSASYSVADAQARLGVEDVHVARLRLEVDLLALLRGATTVDACDERHGTGVLTRGLEELLLRRAVDVGVGA